MLIGIDGNEANVARRVGVNQYAFELLTSLHKLHKKSPKKHNFLIYLKKQPIDNMPKQSLGWHYKVIFGGKVWIITKLIPSLFFSSPRPDLFFSPSHYAPPLAPMPKTCSIMDLRYLIDSGHFRTTDYWQLRLWSAWSIFVSKKVFSISKATKKDIVRHYPFAEKKTVITHLGYDKMRFNTDVKQTDVRRIRKKYSINKDYILFLSTLKPSKNLERLLEAFKLLITKHYPLDTTLVIAGKKGWMYEPIFKKVKELGLTKRIIFTDFVDEKDKAPLMCGAKVFVSPSLAEGFGLIALEAMAVGTPVVVSNIDSLIEVVGKAGVYIDPRNTNDIARGISKVLSMPQKEYNKIVLAGIEQAKKFSWDIAAKKTLATIESIK